MKDSKRQEGHSALQVNNGKIEKFDPHPGTAAGSELTREQLLALVEREQLYERMCAHLTAKLKSLGHAEDQVNEG